MPRLPEGVGPVLATAVAAGGAAGWLLVFVDESRCDRDDGLVVLTVAALLLTLTPTVIALLTRTAWWMGLLCPGTLLLILLAVFRPGGVYSCSFSIVG